MANLKHDMKREYDVNLKKIEAKLELYQKSYPCDIVAEEKGLYKVSWHDSWVEKEFVSEEVEKQWKK